MLKCSHLLEPLLSATEMKLVPGCALDLHTGWEGYTGIATTYVGGTYVDEPVAPDVDEAQREPPPARGRPRPHSTVQTPADDEGWWPVLVLILDPALARILTPVSPGWRVILVICFYQLLGSERFAWWLEIPIWD